jgi:S-adenosylmethionine decarboxylase
MIVGTEWLIEATGCDAARLRDEGTIRGILDAVVADLGLKAIGSVCHTYPEHGTATFNLYCCRARPEWDWNTNLRDLLGAATVSVTRIERGEIENSSTASAGGDA